MSWNDQPVNKAWARWGITGGLIVLVCLCIAGMTGVAYWWFGGEETIQPGPTATLPTAMTAFPPTSTVPPPPTSAPEGSDESATLTPARLYDDFNSDTGGQPYDTSLWDADWDETLGDFSVLQEDGRLRLSLEGEQWGGIGLDPIAYLDVPVGSLSLVEAKMMIASDHRGGHSDFQLKIHANHTDGSFSAVMWQIDVDEHDQPEIRAGIFPGDNEGWDTLFYEASIDYNRWYTVRIEANAGRGKYTFYLDGVKLGTLTADDTEWRNPQTRVAVTCWAAVEAGTSATYYLDDVAIGLAAP